ncbi:MAG: sensor histidine kinase [Thermoleophilaceae bacterium]
MKRLPRGEDLDRVVALGLFVAAQAVLWMSDNTPGPKWATVPLATLMTGAIAVRRRYPLTVAAIEMAGFGALLFAGGDRIQQSIPLSIAWMCGMYALAVWTDTRGFLAGVGILVAGNLIGQLRDGATTGDLGAFTIVPLVALILTRGAVRNRQLTADAHAARAELLEREHELRAHEAVADERARIARELHDLVAHNVSVMVVQAGVERHALGEDQASTRSALESIEQAGRQAMNEARRLLGVLRPGGERENLEPQPGVDQIGTLVEQVQRAGLPVTVAIEGDPEPLPPGLDLCVYRIVQESLTNALKHARPARAEVVLRYAPHALDIEVRDDGRGSAASNGDGSGHGLIGMRERVALYDGELEVGPGAGGGFAVHARLPLP